MNALWAACETMGTHHPMPPPQQRPQKWSQGAWKGMKKIY